MVKKGILILLIFILFIAGCAKSLGPVGSTHEHASFKIYLDGQEFDIYHPKYELRSNYVHMEGGDFTAIHKHATGVTLGFFFNTLGFKLDDKCLKIEGSSYCNSGDKTLKFYINGILQSSKYGEHEIHNGEHYLISYGNDSQEEMQKQLNSVPEPQG